MCRSTSIVLIQYERLRGYLFLENRSKKQKKNKTNKFQFSICRSFVRRVIAQISIQNNWLTHQVGYARWKNRKCIPIELFTITPDAIDAIEKLETHCLSLLVRFRLLCSKNTVAHYS